MTVQHCHNNLEVSWAYTWNLRRPTPLSPNQLYAISRLCPDWFLESLDGKLDPKEVVGNADKSQSGHSGSSYQSVLCATHNTTHNRVGGFSKAAEQNTKRVVWTKWIVITKINEKKCLLHKLTVCLSGGIDDLSCFRTSSSLFFILPPFQSKVWT